MTTALGFAVLVGASVVLGWIAELALPRRPTGGLKGLIILGLVSGLLCGWIAEELGGGPGPDPGGINLAAGVVGTALSSLIVSVSVLYRVFRDRSRT